jgi:hypothetical protein
MAARSSSSAASNASIEVALWSRLAAMSVASPLPEMTVRTEVVEASEVAPPPCCEWSPSPSLRDREELAAAAALARVLKY